jgi:pyridinium-3,5-bisthiocarboxylic acid mononucleotide nickel chelatase
MRGLYFDCFSGISGDMVLGALVDLGVEPAYLRTRLAKLRVGGFTLSASRVTRSGLAGTKVNVAVTPARPTERRLRDIARIVERSGLSPEVRRRSMDAFETLVEAEARVHRVAQDKVHLHEVGAVDAIVDIVGTMIGMEKLGWPRVICSPLHVGRGLVTMEHGTFPVPGPATAEILKGKPTYATEVEGELVTPTGAALAATLATEFRPQPPMRVLKIGYGAGTKQFDHHPNLLRALLGDFLGEPVLRETVLVLETTIDDMNPQLYGHLMERLFAAGALEVFYTPIQMKKNRPGTLVTIICPEPKLEDVTTVVFRETTTIGFRYLPMGRIELARRIETVRTRFGPIRMKVSVYNGEVVQATPEYDDCRQAALRSGSPLKEVQRTAVAAYRPPRGTPGALAAWARAPILPARTRSAKRPGGRR